MQGMFWSGIDRGHVPYESRRVQVMALCWPDPGHEPIGFESLRGRGDDPYMQPPSPRQGAISLG